MKLSLGFSPCPNDTYMMEAMLHGRVSTGALTFHEQIEDVETLNQWALEQKLDVTKLSFNAYLHVREHYDLLSAGAALGRGCGPLVVAKTALTDAQIAAGRIVLPGEFTTAHLLFQIRYPQATQRRHVIFSAVEDLVLEGRAKAGVIIHENRFTYADKGLVQVVDLGSYWEKKTGLPIPLGGFAVRKSLGPAIKEQLNTSIRQSVQYAQDHRDIVMPYVRRFAQEMDDAVMMQHIETYVNEFSEDLGQEGWAAIDRLSEHY